MDFAAASASATDIQNPLDALVGYQLRRASATVLADLAQSLDDLMLKPTEVSVLLLIERNPGITQSDIGRVLAIKRANMAPIARALTARGLINRDRPDGRSQGLRVSDAGGAVSRDVYSRIEIHEMRLLPGLPSLERAALVSLLKNVWAAKSC